MSDLQVVDQREISPVCEVGALHFVCQPFCSFLNTKIQQNVELFKFVRVAVWFDVAVWLGRFGRTLFAFFSCDLHRLCVRGLALGPARVLCVRMHPNAAHVRAGRLGGRASALACARVGTSAWGRMMLAWRGVRGRARMRAARALAATGAQAKPLDARVKLTDPYKPQTQFKKSLGSTTKKLTTKAKTPTKQLFADTPAVRKVSKAPSTRALLAYLMTEGF